MHSSIICSMKKKSSFDMLTMYLILIIFHTFIASGWIKPHNQSRNELFKLFFFQISFLKNYCLQAHLATTKIHANHISLWSKNREEFFFNGRNENIKNIYQTWLLKVQGMTTLYQHKMFTPCTFYHFLSKKFSIKFICVCVCECKKEL